MADDPHAEQVKRALGALRATGPAFHVVVDWLERRSQKAMRQATYVQDHQQKDIHSGRVMEVDEILAALRGERVD